MIISKAQESFNVRVKKLKEQLLSVNNNQKTQALISDIVDEFYGDVSKPEHCNCLSYAEIHSKHGVKLKSKDLQIEELLDRYRLIANNLSDIFFVVDKELNFTFIAPSIEKVLQYTYNELLGKGFDELVPKWSGNTLQKNLNRVLERKPKLTSPERFTVQLSSKHGHLSWYEIQIAGVFSPDNELTGYSGTCRDITERLKYEEALQKAKLKAEESDQLKSAFLANMSHEIRTPLNGIIGFSNLLSNENLSVDKKNWYTGIINSSSKQLLALISDIIDISKIEAGQLDIVYTKVLLKKVFAELEETIKIEKQRLKKPSIQVNYLLPESEESDGLYIDEIRLKQVLINFLSNALKFTESGTITAGYERQGNKFRFFVKDSGPGISSALTSTIFERFRQGDVDGPAKIAGTGLGLAISKGLIELMGGEIGVNSQVGKGAEFYFVLPDKER